MHRLKLCFGLFLIFTSAAVADAPVRLVENNWTTQAVMAHITAHLLKQLGYESTFVPSTSDDQWGLFKYGHADVQMELWEGTMRSMWHRMHKRGLVVDMGNHEATSREDWWYPLYVEEQCPGLPDWEALKHCWKLFVHEETTPLGRYFTGPWEKPDAARIRALGLQFRVIRTSEQGLIDALLDAIQRKEPIVLFNWVPNWIQLKHPGRFVEFPIWTSECEKEASWGINPDLPFDCGNPRVGWLKKFVHKDFYAAHPCAVQLIKRISFDQLTLAQFSLDAYEGLDTQTVANTWLSLNVKTWKSWLALDCHAESDNQDSALN